MAILSTLVTDAPGAISPTLTTDIAVTVMMFCNLNTPDPLDDTIGRQFLDIYIVASGGTPDTVLGENKIANQIPVDAGDTFTFSAERLVLASGDRVWAATTDTNQVSVTISYVVI
jgi:hypothetical protein